jgi:hypothetical protein
MTQPSRLPRGDMGNPNPAAAKAQPTTPSPPSPLPPRVRSSEAWSSPAVGGPSLFPHVGGQQWDDSLGPRRGVPDTTVALRRWPDSGGAMPGDLQAVDEALEADDQVASRRHRWGLDLDLLRLRGARWVLSRCGHGSQWQGARSRQLQILIWFSLGFFQVA